MAMSKAMKADRAKDKKAGIKEGSKKDKAKDRKVKGYK
jgi:hypothetical protein